VLRVATAVTSCHVMSCSEDANGGVHRLGVSILNKQNY